MSETIIYSTITFIDHILISVLDEKVQKCSSLPVATNPDPPVRKLEIVSLVAVFLCKIPLQRRLSLFPESATFVLAFGCDLSLFSPTSTSLVQRLPTKRPISRFTVLSCGSKQSETMGNGETDHKVSDHSGRAANLTLRHVVVSRSVHNFLDLSFRHAPWPVRKTMRPL